MVTILGSPSPRLPGSSGMTQMSPCSALFGSVRLIMILYLFSVSYVTGTGSLKSSSFSGINHEPQYSQRRLPGLSGAPQLGQLELFINAPLFYVIPLLVLHSLQRISFPGTFNDWNFPHHKRLLVFVSTSRTVRKSFKRI